MKENQIIKKLDDQVLSVIGDDAIHGFKKAYVVAQAVGELKTLLNDNYMKPIMDLQGNKLGFKTDRDKDGGYSLDIVKNCLIEAVLTGVEPVGNQFNIIKGQCYITKEGFKHLLSKQKGLWYNIVPNLPRINSESTSAAIVMDIQWSIDGGNKNKSSMDIPIKVNKLMGTDAVIGKATRKARAWLFNTITGCEIGDGDASDLEVIEVKPQTVEDKKKTMKDKIENLP